MINKERERLHRIVNSAISTFKGHELIYRNDELGLWTIAKRYEDGNKSIRSEYYTEIYAGSWGHITVGGDIDYCVFGYYSDKRHKGAGHKHAMLKWLGCSTSFGYIREKACIGLSCSGMKDLSTTNDEDVALEKIDYEIKTLKDEIDADPDSRFYDAQIEAWREARALVTGEDLTRAEIHVCDNVQDGWEFLPLGEVTSSRVIYAWAAMRRACELLGFDVPKVEKPE